MIMLCLRIAYEVARSADRVGRRATGSAGREWTRFDVGFFLLFVVHTGRTQTGALPRLFAEDVTAVASVTGLATTFAILLETNLTNGHPHSSLLWLVFDKIDLNIAKFVWVVR